MEEFSSYIQNHQYPHYYHHSHYPLHYNPNANYYEPYNFYESYEPEVYYDYYEPPSEQDITFSIQELNEQLKSMENQVNERFDKLERALGQIAEGVKELQQSQEMSENVWTSPVALEVEPLVPLEPVHFNITEETHDDVMGRESKADALDGGGVDNNEVDSCERKVFAEKI
ncbi:hypothetical protein CASFOL_034939 [Castilleja foliolosa]|uniref:Deformed n=1 Tax=Castilleja foliolosa TaxID=1961234 RepID=A0ABD3BTI9_9LAMI